MNRYPTETLDPDDDDGTMPDNVEALRQAVVGHRIAKAERSVVRVTDPEYGWPEAGEALVLTLDDGRSVVLMNEADCCAYTELEAFLAHPERVNHVITGVGTTDGYTRWHVYADMGDVLELTVGWSCGNPFYYGYGFNIVVSDEPPEVVESDG